ncbi:thiamine-phosphate kinase [Dokdonella koreensis]|uniref:Thiamine-monophosphate kinase n=1 Tax=Dokdonella koreensis DS-123 TaxID=1300342 RepID=A0A167GKV6_9GAMM|nr:thiamine-phosphate kinase [Dokdonella koreensis]ANB16673.1 Thiamine-monophosphate kinase [Dokdonella koreensis DS-123]
MSEFDLIDLIRRRAGIERNDVRLGIGDDAALVLPPPGHELAICTDTLVAGVHFPADTAAADIGWKALAVNLSDLAAMGATPAWALLALTLPTADAAFVEAFCTGFGALAAQHRVALIGGDTTSGPLTITVTVHGFVPPEQALRRDGARVGDAVFVTGTLGDAAAALWLRRRSGDPALRAQLDPRLDRPEPRIAAGAALRGAATACIDVSDGLLADLGHIADRSGVGIDIETDALPSSPALLGAFAAADRARLQLAGGDDYELAFTAPAHRAGDLQRDLARIGCGATRIGRVVEGAGVRALDADGAPITLPARGWEHFA